MIRQIIVFLVMWTACLICASAQDEADALANPDEDFVIASVVVASPGEEVASSMGHACLRLKCPEHDLDYIFSYESQDLGRDLSGFFAGKLEMGVKAIPAQEYIDSYTEEGRGIKEYVLNLPIAVKQRMWQQMDKRLEWASVPYDYMNRSCSVSVLSWLVDAIDADSIVFGAWDEKYVRSRKAIAEEYVRSPWAHFFMDIVISGQGNDTDVNPLAKVMVPAELELVICKARAYGKPLVGEAPRVLFEPSKSITYSWFTPMMMSLSILLLAVANLFLHIKALRIPVLVLGALLGMFVCYLVCVSDLVCTEWNWLLIPFCPVPLLFWKWRKYWAIPFGIIILVWCIGVKVIPDIIFDDALIILALAEMLVYFEIYKHLNTERK